MSCEYDCMTNRWCLWFVNMSSPIQHVDNHNFDWPFVVSWLWGEVRQPGSSPLASTVHPTLQSHPLQPSERSRGVTVVMASWRWTRGQLFRLIIQITVKTCEQKITVNRSEVWKVHWFKFSGEDMGTDELCVKGLFWLALLFFSLLQDFHHCLCFVHVK